MLGHFKTRRIAALLALASVTNAAGYLAAQGPAGGRTGARTPTRIANCDITVESCGGDPVLGGGNGGGSPGGSAPGGNSVDCGTGSRVECRKDSTWRCLQWVGGGANAGAGPGGVNAGTTMVCSSSITTVIRLYWP